MNKILTTLIGVLTLLAAAHAFAADTQTGSIVGKWSTENEESIVEIYKNENTYSAKIIWLKEPHYPDGTDKKDRHNPDKSMRDRTIVGIDIVWGLQDKGKNTWTAGTVYDPNNGKSYSCNAKLKGDKLFIRGYVGTPFFGKTTVWTRKQ